MEKIEHAFSADWRTINNEIMGHALAPVEQQKMEYKELKLSFGDVNQLPPVCKNRN
jgi:hypothetical protein